MSDGGGGTSEGLGDQAVWVFARSEAGHLALTSSLTAWDMDKEALSMLPHSQNGPFHPHVATALDSPRRVA